MDRLLTLKLIASKEMLSFHEAAILITEYILDRTGQRVVITGELNKDLFEKAATIATNYYIIHE